LSDVFFYMTGLVFLALAKAKHTLRGYTTPKPFSLNEAERCIDYDVHIADLYLESLTRYASTSVQGKRILELGPGSDLGCGLYLVYKGAASYIGFDRNDLASDVPNAFYERFAERVPVDLAALADGRVTYTAREDFSIAAGVAPGIDIVFSNAAFEHFADVNSTIAQLSRVMNPGGIIVAEIDLQTHSRWIRDADPNNIYRYPEWLYRIFRFPGSPNRLRPSNYLKHFQAHGWTSITMTPANELSQELVGRRAHPRFQDDRMTWLSFVLCATRH
jgi:SAM-dependent methyltransferase